MYFISYMMYDLNEGFYEMSNMMMALMAAVQIFKLGIKILDKMRKSWKLYEFRYNYKCCSVELKLNVIQSEIDHACRLNGTYPIDLVPTES